MYCRKCGKEIREGAEFCGFCGQRVIPVNGTGAGAGEQQRNNQAAHGGQAQRTRMQSGPTQSRTHKSKAPIIAGAVAVCLLIVVVLAFGPLRKQLFGRSERSNSNPQTNMQQMSDTTAGTENENSEPEAAAAPESAEAEDSYTILVYMIGSNLESESGAATKDLVEMANAAWGDEINLLVETGGATEWQNSIVSADSLQRYEVYQGNMNLEDEQPLEQMSTPSALSDYISWGTSNYPAKHYGLILWDHGGGLIGGYGADELFDMEGMSIPEVTEGIRDAGTHFDFVGYDACLMASFESAYALKDCADYLIASEESETGIGWYYTDWLNTLGQNPDISMEELGRSIIDGMIDDNQEMIEEAEARGVEREKTSTLSLIDLSKMEDVREAWTSYMEQLYADLDSDSFAVQAVARANARTYGDSQQVDPETGEVWESHFDMVDMLDFIDETALTDSYDIEQTIRSCIVYCNADISGSNGLSVYMPYYKPGAYGDVAVPYLEEIGLDGDYFDYFDSFGSYLASGNADIDFVASDGDTQTAGTAEVTIPDYIEYSDDSEGNLVIPFTEDQWGQIATVYVEQGIVNRNFTNDDGDTVLRIYTSGEELFEPQKSKNGDFIPYFDGGETSIYSPDMDDWYFPYFMIADSGTYDDGTKFAVKYAPAYLEGTGTIVIVVEMEYRSADDYSAEVTGYFPYDSEEAGQHTLLQFEDGDEISFPWFYYDLDEGPDEIHAEGQYDTLTIGDSESLEADYDLFTDEQGQKSYAYRYVIYDIYDNVHYTQWLYY
ncbi:MAG: clostripain-related cysteine peptidase [Eubacterium sp.]|nr:clostripain-related cysteine peptidase [Eubacterium sp.]